MYTYSVCSLALPTVRVWEQQYSSNNEHINSQLLISTYHSQKKKKGGLGQVEYRMSMEHLVTWKDNIRTKGELGWDVKLDAVESINILILMVARRKSLFLRNTH